MSARTVTLAQVAARLEQERLLVRGATADINLLGVADDSRAVQPGDVFCAWSGTTSDSHGFADVAVTNGAVAVIGERELPVRVPQLTVTDGRRAAAIAASVVFGAPEQQLRLVGVTGTNGKTTSVWLLRHVLSQQEPTASLGTLGAILEDGSVLPGSEALTTPGPVAMSRLLRLLVDRGVRSVAMEVSSHALHQGRVHALRFDAALFTNLSRDHLDYHGTEEAYRDAKRSLVMLLRADGCAVINADDRAWDGLAAQAPRTLTFGVEQRADVYADSVSLTAAGATFRLVSGGRDAQVELPLPGAFNVSNALGVAATALGLGLSVDAVARALGTVPQVPGRLERIATQPCPVVRDYAHTPDALERVLGTLGEVTAGRVIVVFGAGGDRDRGKRPLMGAVAARGADVAIVTSDNPRTEDPDAIIDEVEAGMGDTAHVRVTDRREAIAHALRIAAADDVVLLAGKGHEDYQIIGTEKLPFDERQIVAGLTGVTP